MSPEQMEQIILELQEQVAALNEYVEERKIQQITIPLDEASRQIIGAGIETEGEGSTPLTQNVAVNSTPTSIAVPKGYAGRILVSDQDGATYEIPYLSVS